MKFVAFCAFLSLTAVPCLTWAATSCDGAGNCYIRAASSCTSSCGATWSAAYSGFGTGASQINPASMTRGVTYWIAAGNYGTVNFSTAASGTSVITVNVATTSSHGPDSTWSNSYAGQAQFGGDSAISTSYWVISGQSWGSPCSGLMACNLDSAYNLYFLNTTHLGSTDDILTVGPGTNISITYADLQGPGTAANWSTVNGNSDDGLDVSTGNGAQETDNLYVGYSYIHDATVDLVGSNGQSSVSNVNGSGHIFEHDAFSRNWHGGTGTDDPHTQAMSECVTNFTVRYNIFYDTVEDGTIDINVSNTCPISNWAIYGNEIYWDNSVPSNRIALVGGILGMYGETITGYFYVVNNTVANLSPLSGANVNMSLMWICGTSCNSSASGATIVVANNLFWQSGSAGGSGKAVDYSCDSTCTTEVPSISDYNVGYCPTSGCTGGTGYSPQGSHDIATNSGNPFVNFDGSSNFNVALNTDTSAGTAVTGWASIPSGCTSGVNCMNVDGFGVIRGANGTIDRGALQISGSSSAPSSPPAPDATVH